MRADSSLPSGFSCAGISAGIKAGKKKDMALIVSDRPAVAAGVFTQNRICAAPVKLCRQHLKNGQARAIVMNSGIANACTGAEGMTSAQKMAEETAQKIGCASEEVFVCSTGRIGPQLPLDKIEAGIERLVESASPEGVAQTAEAMMTTDTRPKTARAQFLLEGKSCTLFGFAKGAGMIEPNMATMLSFIVTDAAVEKEALQTALKHAVDQSFNRVSIDGDQSTNDTVLLLSNAAAGNAPLCPEHTDWSGFCQALDALCFDLAMQILHDGEGADRFVTVQVEGAARDADAERIARAIANSLLNKTAWAGTYPNWGRVMDAIGYSGAEVVEEQVQIFYDTLCVVENGMRSDTPQEKLVEVVSQPEFTLRIDLHLGEGTATVYTCNCTEEYVRINVE